MYWQTKDIFIIQKHVLFRKLCHSTPIQLPIEQGGIQRGKHIHTVKKMECAQMDMEKLDLHHSFLNCCWPQIHPYYILDDILMADSQ